MRINLIQHRGQTRKALKRSAWDNMSFMNFCLLFQVILANLHDINLPAIKKVNYKEIYSYS